VDGCPTTAQLSQLSRAVARIRRPFVLRIGTKACQAGN